MHTRLLTNPREAADVLRQGGIVALPTETVYGLAARFDQTSAVEQIFAAKQRPADNPLIVHLANTNWLSRIAAPIPPIARQLLEQFAPGPLTVTLPRHRDVPHQVTAGLDTVAVRIPNSPLFQQVLASLDIPLVAPSANRSGRPSPTTWQAAWHELDGRVDAVLRGPAATVGIESTVVDCVHEPPRLLRPGAVTFEALQVLVPDLQLLGDASTRSARLATSRLPSPGMRHRHYAPSAQVHLFDTPAEVSASADAYYLAMQPHPQAESFAAHHCWPDITSYAQYLFATFFQADQAGIQHIYCQRVPLSGIGRGLMDRLQRAADR